MSTTAASFETDAFAPKRLEVLFEELAELCGQRNAIDGRVVEIIAEIDGDELWGGTRVSFDCGVGGVDRCDASHIGMG